MKQLKILYLLYSCVTHYSIQLDILIMNRQEVAHVQILLWNHNDFRFNYENLNSLTLKTIIVYLRVLVASTYLVNH